MTVQTPIKRDRAAVMRLGMGIIAACWFSAAWAGESAADLTVEALTVAASEDIEDSLTVTWMGVTTLVISDGKTNLMTDGYFSRIAIESFEAPIEPDRPVIDDALKHLGLTEAAAVMVVHSHFDHALDAPIVAAATGATLVGSESTANIGRGLGLPEKQIRVADPGTPISFGDFEVTFVVSKHWPLPEPLASAILNRSVDEPLTPPASFADYKEGKTYSILITHPLGSLLVQGSAGYVPGALVEYDVDAVMLGTGGLGDLPLAEQHAYYREIVEATDAGFIYPIHWDKMSTPLSEPFQPDTDFERSMQFLETKRLEGGAGFGLLPKGKPAAVRKKVSH